MSRGKVRVTVMATGKFSEIQNLIPLNLIEVSRTKVHFTFHFNFRQKCKVLVFQARKSTALNADFKILLVLLFPNYFLERSESVAKKLSVPLYFFVPNRPKAALSVSL